MPVEITVLTESGEMTDTVVIDEAFQTCYLSVDAPPVDVLLDRDGWVLKEVTEITTPRCMCTEYSIDDGTGDGDGIPDPGETVTCVVTLVNTGTKVTGLEATLSTDDPDVAILDGTAELGSVEYGQTASNAGHPFAFEVNAHAASKVVLFLLGMTADGGYSTTDSLYIAIGPPTVLLVDDDAGAAYESYYTDGLLFSYPFDVWEVAVQGTPGDTLSHYEAVVWFTGDDRASTLTSEEQAALKEYLDDGGNLFVTGQNIGYDLVEIGSAAEAAFYSDYLHAEYVSDASPEDILSGVSGDPISGDVFFLSLTAGGAGNQNSPSVIEPQDGARSVLVYHPSGTAAAIRYSGDHKVVYFAFGYEGLGDFGPNHAKMRASLMANVIQWFRHVPQKGDVNEDGVVNVLDVVAAVNIILGVGDPTPSQFWSADYTDDGTVNVLDVVNLVNAILGSPVSSR